MKFNGVDFNEDVVISQSLNDFVNSESNAHLWPDQPVEQRKAWLSQVHTNIIGNSTTTYFSDQQDFESRKDDYAANLGKYPLDIKPKEDE